jgi:phage tail-like protein
VTATTKSPATAMRFDVTVDGEEIGSFTAIDGLSAKFDIKTYAEGGENGYVHRLPGRLSFGTIKLTRPVDMRTNTLGKWFLSIARGGSATGHTAAVTALDVDLSWVVRWEFTGVWPVSYTGPSFAADAGKVATEVFEFAHDGWTETRRG